MSKNYTFEDWWREFGFRHVGNGTAKQAAKVAWEISAENSRVPDPPPCQHPSDKLVALYETKKLEIDWCSVCGAYCLTVNQVLMNWQKHE